MKEKIITALISCDWWNSDVKSSKEMCPSSSIEEIAEYLATDKTLFKGCDSYEACT